MINWRKYFIHFLFKISNSKIPEYYKKIKSYNNLTIDEIKNLRNEKLIKIIIHAFKNTVYYNKILKDSGVIDADLNVNLNNFSKIPVLTKEIIRKENINLYSKDRDKRKPYENTSGGSTGEPVKFIQDRMYNDINVICNKFYFNYIHGKEIGEKEINIWGSERDIFKNSLSLKEKIINFLYNRTFLNSFKLNEEKINDYIKIINKIKPKSMWVYVESIDYISKYIIKNNIKVYPPDFIITTAGTLYPEIRDTVQKAFNCRVYNQYGSREIGPAAFECNNQKGLHFFPWSHYLEVIDGIIYATVLTNYSMPLIRYKIGDTAVLSKHQKCGCRLNTLMFDDITGRIINHFKTENNEVVHGQYFIHLFYFRENVKRFQVVQNKINEIICRISGELSVEEEKDIINKIKIVMGRDCKVEFDYKDHIEQSVSGKYIYTICNI